MSHVRRFDHVGLTVALLISDLAIRAAWGSASVKTNPDGG